MKQRTIKIISISIGMLVYASVESYTGPFNDPGNGTIVDQRSGLVWQKCPNGQGTAGNQYTDCAVGTAVTSDWSNALAYCNALNLNGITGWRLPSVKELVSLVDYSRPAPPFSNAVFFPNAGASYWTSTTHPSGTNKDQGYYVSFGVGTYDTIVKTTLLGVRCVR
ncbi:DUF1566 domain-containing protein [Leptospira yasudae]|uniref:Lcl C-terminal domain-containing protein n=1 Tax=Leptospira yasudae TaxID=2202201 RepID=UPI001090CE0C|nr:DUF1566 domain-containing protein [Leptospira yasudae]MBW0434374.1 DUF1566 domain-containing protein [Leptospira yasudae]TGM99208.1 DUF1566 domain-containing protein [Leptospira yasudae]